jgi:23S rRNA (cytidine2498-2'-O)-methyltransferase
MTTPHSDSVASAPPQPWLVRIPEVFAVEAAALVRRLSPTGSTLLGTEYHLLKSSTAAAVGGPGAVLHVCWRLPVEHSWPCRPRTMEGFVEKGAQALARKFADRSPQTILVGLLHTGTPNSYYKKLASNLRGRALQLFPALTAAPVDAEDQHSERPTLYCLIGPEGLYAGVTTPKEANGFYPGGTKHLPHDAADAISRAGAKIAEALHFLRLHRAPLSQGAQWLELGASPGGMTAELLSKGFRVTAVDRASLDRRLDGARGLTFVQSDAPTFRAPPGVRYDALLCDLNGDARSAMRAVLSQRASLRPGAPVVFTLKLAGVDSVAGTLSLRDEVVAMAEDGGLDLVAQTHLRANKREFTLFFENGRRTRARPPESGRRDAAPAPAPRGRRGPRG